MGGTVYKCPSCGAYLNFDPESQQWKCPFCDSQFQEKELLEREKQEEENEKTARASQGEQMVYHCPSCGSEIMTDETTVATHCYYCHSPVVLQGKLESDMRPDSVLPFTIDKDKAVKTFMDWVKGKRFVPKGFFSQQEIETMSGVYYPHFVTECEVDGSIDGEGRNVSVADTGNYIVTSTRHYHVRREADIHFQNIMRPALSSTNRKLSDGIHPFPLEKAKPFTGAYLSGFLAERRDMDAESIRADVEREVQGYVQPLLSDDLTGYDQYSVNTSSRLKGLKSRYLLLPTWVLTYPNRQDVKNPYYYVMNGCTGEVCGKLPIDKKKLYLTGLGIMAAIFAVGCVLSYFLF